MRTVNASMTDMSFILLAIFFLAAVVSGAEKNFVTFLYPPAGLTLNYMDTVNVSYTSQFPKPVLYTFCTKPNSRTTFTKLIQNVSPKNASTLVLLSWLDVTSCYFDLRPSNPAGNSTNSNYIRVLSQARPTPIIVGLNQNSTTIPVDATNTVTITAVPSSDGMSSGTKIGIGVGVALGVVLIFAAGLAAFLLRRRRKVKNQAAIQLLNVDGDSWKSDFGNEPQRQFVLMQPMPREMQAKSPPGQVYKAHELLSDTTFELDNEGAIGELSTEGGLQQAGPRRFSWERGRVG